MTKPIIAWMGGKRRLAKTIIPMIPDHTCYCEAFAGGAAIFFMKEQSKVEVINDINSELVNLYRVVQHHLEELVRQFKWALTSREIYLWQKDTPVETLTDVQRAARFYYILKLSFGGKATGSTFGISPTTPPRLNLTRIEEDLSDAHLRLSRVTIENLPWDECIQRYDRPGTFFYLDPPYHKTAGYGTDFGVEQYHRMAELANSMAGKCLISINDHEDIRAIFKGMKMKRVSLRYTVGGVKKGAKQSGELIIQNWR